MRAISVYDRVDSSLVCFDVHFSRPGSLQYTFLTEFQPAFGHYLTVAQRFLADVGRLSNFRGEIVWRIEDDSTISDKSLSSLHKRGVVIFGHAVLRTSSGLDMYYLVPDFHFLDSAGFSSILRGIQTRNLPFQQRKSQIFWAGSTTGLPCGGDAICAGECKDVQRIRFVEEAAGIAWLNCSLTRANQWCAGVEEDLRARGLMSVHVPEVTWTDYRGVFDIDGNVHAWGARWRYALGNVVFKVQSKYVSHYTSALIDGVHFISIAANFSDLYDKTSIILDDSVVTVDMLRRMSERASRIISTFTYEAALKNVRNRLDLRSFKIT